MDKRFNLFALVFLLFCGFVSASGSFQVNNLLLKVSMHSGDTVNKTLSITSDVGGEFSTEIIGIKGVSISDSSFSLAKGESKSLNLIFDSRGLSTGAHVGSVKVTSRTEVSYIPIIFEIESKEVLFDINLDIPPQYTTISPGDKLLAQIKVYDLTSGGTSEGLGSSKVDVEYNVMGIDGQVISSESETIVVNKQTQITKSLSFPKDAKLGDYVFSAKVNYPGSVGVASSLFSLIKSDTGIFSFSNFGQSGTIIVIFSGILLFFMILLLVFIYFVKDRDKLILELRKYNEQEMERQQKFLVAQGKILKEKSGYESDKVKEEIDKNLRKLKEKHKNREEELKRLKDSGNIDEMGRKLNEWKKEGYNTSGLDYQLKGMKVSDMKDILKQWKKEYSTEDYKNKK